MKLEETRGAVNNSMFENHICTVEDEEVHKLCGPAGSQTSVVDCFGFVVELDGYSADFDALKVRLLGWRARRIFCVILKVEEAGDKIQSILVYVESNW